MKAQKFYVSLLEMKGDGFFVVARKHARRVWLLAAMLLAVGLTSYFVKNSELGVMVMALTCMGAGACAAINGGIEKRKRVWPYLDELIDWERVVENVGSPQEQHH